MKKKQNRDVPKQLKKDGVELRGIVRISGVDLRGDLKLKRAMKKIKGVGARTSSIFSEIISSEISKPESVLVGELNDEDVKKVEYVINNPVKFGVPEHMVNRRKDYITGDAMHLTGTDLSFTMKKDIERDQNMNSWRGYRHTYGQKVRGQRSRTTGRQGMSVGVVRKSLAKGGAAKPPGKKDDKK